MNTEAPLQQVKPKNARSARALKAREPQVTENPRITLFCRYTSASQDVLALVQNLARLKQPLCHRFDKKNTLYPFLDASSFEFFSEKNDASLIVFSSHSKKRPHAMTFMRMFDHKLLDMMELLLDPTTMRTLTQFKNSKKPALGLRPLICFSGTPFENPTPNEYTLAKSLFLDFFKGEETTTVDVEGLQYMVHISAADEVDGQPPPQIHLRFYLIRTKRAGSRLPRVELEEMGPRADFRVGRTRQADPELLKQAMKRPRGTQPKTKKNIETDAMGDKIGRIHMGKQDLSKLQTRKMKGLKRSRDLDVDTAAAEMESMEVDGEDDVMSPKKPRVG